jgi:hypothetical protein
MDEISSILKQAGITNQDTSNQSTPTAQDIMSQLDNGGLNSSQGDQLGNQDYNGECQKYVEQETYGHAGIFPTAVDAWNSYVKSGQAFGGDVAKAPAGDLIYFAPDSGNGGDGHVSISDGQGGMTSATYNGVQHQSISGWLQSTGQTPLGYVKP